MNTPTLSGIKKDTREQGGEDKTRGRGVIGETGGAGVTRVTGRTRGTRGTGATRIPVLPVFPKSGRCQPLLFLCATKLRKVLCHFWWQKWRKSHAPHLWRSREPQSLKRMLRRQSVCRLRFLTALRLSPAATAKSVAYPPTMRSAGFRCACGAVNRRPTIDKLPPLFAGSFFDTREQRGVG